MNKNVVLTVTVPVYNTEAYLDKCLGSLVVSKELMDLLEVLVVIDGSKDNSIEIARKYEKNYPNTFRVIDKENGGHGSCCNVGVSEARGKYIHFLDSDDWFDDQFSSYLLRLQEESADAVFTKSMREKIYENKSILHYYHNIEYDKRFSLESLINIVFTFSLHEVSYSVKLFREYHVSFREKAYYDDTLFTVAGFLGINQIAFYDLILYHYLLGRPGQTIDPVVISKHFKDRCYATCDCFDLYKNSQDNISRLSNELILKNLGWNLECLYAYAWNQKWNSAKEDILSLNKLFKLSTKNIAIKKNYLVAIAFYLPFSCGYFLIHHVIKKVL